MFSIIDVLPVNTFLKMFVKCSSFNSDWYSFFTLVVTSKHVIL